MSRIFEVETARLHSAGRVHANATWAYPAHTHQHWEFIYFLRGCGRIDLPHAILRPQQYHLVVYPPGLPHAEITDPVDPEETIFFGLDVAGVPPSGAHLLLPDQQGELRWLCERIVTEFQAAGGTPLAETYARAFLYLLERAWETGLPVPHDPIDFAVQYLHENYMQPITLCRLAEAARMSKTHLSHRFRARLGISPIHYLQRVRLDAATRLLTTTQLPIGAVAGQTGFTDPLYFSRVCKRITGLSPKALRQHAESAR